MGSSSTSEQRARRAVVAFLARELDEGGLRASGWQPRVGATRWYATYTGGNPDRPYKMPGPGGAFTRHRGDHPERLYRLDDEGGWVLDPPAGAWCPHDAPVRLHELGRLSAEEVEALYRLDDWGGWYFDYREGRWERPPAPVVSYYLAELALHEVDRAEAARVAAALGAPSAV